MSVIVILPFLLGFVLVFMARTKRAKIVALVFGSLSLGFGAYFAWGIAHPPFWNVHITIIGGLSTALISLIVTYVMDKPQSPTPALSKKRRRVPRGCWIFIAIILILGARGYFYMRAPHFHGSTVSIIEIKMFAPNLTPGSKPLVDTSITNPSACASVFELLRSARYRMDHKCGDIGSFTVRYSSGKSDVLDFLPGHDPTAYEFRLNRSLYRVSRDRFYQVLRDAGVDTTNIPESEH
jgi:hypothetical protein